jgi:hypothetical protein
MGLRDSIKGLTDSTPAWLVSKPILIVLLLIGLGAATAGALDLTRRWNERVLERPERAAFLEELRPVALKNCNLKRLGGANDGGYLLCDNLSEGIKSAYSYGVGEWDNFGCDISKRYSVPVHQYDCFDPARPTCPGGTFVFHDECIGPRIELDKQKRIFDTLKSQISRNQDDRKRLIVKMDIEGAEWKSLLATPDDVLDQIDQMPMELHIWDGLKKRHVEAIRKLKEKFYVVNLHFNNNACVPNLEPIPSWAFQVLLVNKRLGELDPSAPVPAPVSPLNAPDNPSKPDCQLPAARP